MSVSKSCFHNDCVSHPEADKTWTDGRFSYQYYYSSFDQLKNYPVKKIIIGRKRGPAKTIFGQKSGPAMAGPAVPPTTALYRCTQTLGRAHTQKQVTTKMLCNGANQNLARNDILNQRTNGPVNAHLIH